MLIDGNSSTNGNLYFGRYNSGSVVDYPFKINNASGLTTISDGLAVAGSFSAPGLVTNADLASTPANSYKCNASTSASTPSDCYSNASNPFDFGAVANSSAAAATNTTAFQNAMAANPVFHCPDGQTFYIGGITVPTTTTRIYGACTLIASGTVTSGAGLLEADSNTGGLVIDGPRIQVATGTYTNNSGIRLSGSSNFNVRNTTITAANGVLVNAGTNFTLENNYVLNDTALGIAVVGASSFGHISNNYVNAGYSSGSSHCIAVEQGSNYTITGNHVEECVGFGINVSSPSSAGTTSFFTVANNVAYGTQIECINVENGAVGAVTGNACYFNSHSTDFGMSFYGAPGTSPQEITSDIAVTGNSIFNPCKSGIALADVVTRLNVTGNYIYAPNQCAGTTGDYTSGILLYGAATVPTALAITLSLTRTGTWHGKSAKERTTMEAATPAGTSLRAWPAPLALPVKSRPLVRRRR
ncbi:right-handed parallel beta-helix repeat-containing protein [Paraburkholderia acidisoli]|uniref:Right handed beta helix domain-containing protein n=1 Tax=Paraburkholderia acidisoli TaxID=2571748 RepID=A0A7Z2GQT5_9BURK|nr:right-handed parallel beta-helix repeat-containing protein [Paraburkholderia acidisoli]QGZ66257.1 hypothetical protein FAZ98_31130 [Paraburkholderia acidisoli]